MSEQMIQNALYSKPVQFGKYTCRSLGATTIQDLIKSREIAGLTLKECKNIKANKPDVLILNKNKEIVVFIEMKQPSDFNSDKLKQIAKYQELEVAKQTKSKIYVISDGNTFIWFNPKTGKHILDEKSKQVLTKINPNVLTEEDKKSLSEFISEVANSIDDTNNQIYPKEYLDPTCLAKQIARILQNMSLSTAKNSLYTFVELFTFKFLSDIEVLTGLYSFKNIYEIYQKDSVKDAFITYLTIVRNQLINLFPVAEDNTTIINGRIFHTQIDQMGNPIIIENAAKCFGELLECFKKYEDEHGKFLYIKRDFKSKLFETFMKNSSDKDEMGQFFTPLKVVQEMVNMVDIRKDMSICDPACGVGKFLLEASLKIPKPFYFENGNFRCSIKLVGLEKRMEDNNDDLTTILAKSNLLLFYSDLFKDNKDDIFKIQILANELLNKVIKSSHSTLGTLEHLIPESYDLILANPPYYRSAPIMIESKSVHIEGSEIKAYTCGGHGIETLFIEWIIKSLKKGGEANIILPNGVFTNLGNTKLKQFILENCYIETIISLPIGTFFNTPKKTFILTIHKRNEDEENLPQPYPVYTYLCSSIGETLDIGRYDIDENDLHDSVILYSLYKHNKNSNIVIDQIKNNPRAKLVNIDYFNKDSNWDINLIWTDEEKEKLGIKKSDNFMSIDEFQSFAYDLVDDIKYYMESIKCLK